MGQAAPAPRDHRDHSKLYVPTLLVLVVSLNLFISCASANLHAM